MCRVVAPVPHGVDGATGQGALDVGAHLTGGLVAVGAVLGQRLEHDGVDRGGQLGVEAGRRDRLLADVLVGDRDGGVADERWPAREQLVEQAPGGVEVAAGIDLLATRLLGREVLGGADHGRGLRHRRARVGEGPCDPEVHDLDLAGAGQHHVGRLDVAVHDAAPVAVVERVEHACGDLQRPLGQQPATGVQQLAQRRAVDVLHDDVGHRADPGRVLAGVVDRDDGRMVQRGRRLRLTPEPRLERRVAGEVGPQHLHRDLPAEPQVVRQVDLGHAPAPEHVADLVAVAEHQRRVGH
jgi:hypothetical protein